jgi:RHS repeat-associated protein
MTRASAPTPTYGPTGLPRGTTTQAVPQPYRYSGTYLDPTGLYKMGHRYYDPQLGRFTQPDPSGQETNPYLYAGGDPINNSDPTGLLSLDTLGNIGSGVSVAGIVYEGLTGGPDAAEAATAGVIADIGITGLCVAGAGFFGGPAGAGTAAPYCAAMGTAAGMYVAANYQNNLT